jgi:hypothetical protein
MDTLCCAPSTVEVRYQTIVETIHLGDGIPLETPKDHWSLRDED